MHDLEAFFPAVHDLEGGRKSRTERQEMIVPGGGRNAQCWCALLISISHLIFSFLLLGSFLATTTKIFDQENQCENLKKKNPPPGVGRSSRISFKKTSRETWKSLVEACSMSPPQLRVGAPAPVKCACSAPACY